MVAISFLVFNNQKSNHSSKEMFLASVYNNEENYNDVFSKLTKVEVKAKAKAGIVSHHFLAKQMIADFYNAVGNNDTSTIFLISPNHYNNFYPTGVVAYTSNLTWQTPFGNLLVNRNANNYLIEKKRVKSNDSLLAMEHGIYVEMPFIKKFFPNAKVVPLVVNMGIGYDDFLLLGKEIKKMSDGNSVLIISSDFSHDLSIEEAERKDKLSIEVLNNLKGRELSEANNDCRQCLAVLQGFLSDNQNYDFNLIDNKNSFDFSDYEEETVTSYVTGYYTLKGK
jgi:AmmeMemoRadiSam system protein B